MSDPTTSPSLEGLDAIRDAYQNLAEGEKAKIMRFTARHRFTDDNFENWLSESGLLQGELRREMIAERQLPPVREKLDSTLLENKSLMQDTITKYLAQGNPDLLKSVIEWVRAERGRLSPNPPEAVLETVNSNNAPDTLSSDPQYGLVRAVMEAHWLDHKLVELAGNDPELETVAEELEPTSPVLPEDKSEEPASSIPEKLDTLKVDEDAFAKTNFDDDSPLDDLGKAGIGIAATTAASNLVSDRVKGTEPAPIETVPSVESFPILDNEKKSLDVSAPEAESLPERTPNPLLMNKVESLQSYCDELEQKLAEMRRASKDVEVLSVLKSATQAFTLIDEIHEEAGDSADWDSIDELRSFASGTADAPSAPESSDPTSLGNELLSKLNDSASDFGSSLLGDDTELPAEEPEVKKARGPFNSFM
tara:strand:- start:10245 stop:11507 length:1263 start_codon:yes stop_codon:yes gene_type:complete